ncbi:putative membrane protein [Wickerhamomyces ciferrii]|uniref:Membrane protein n=1 Tax=Wickerhamomyces ciferrii (strain ATCC 14091 / BCRC 22168 / CBS 111 / JCM 3599 / NBRC 0793 / NRRL Y-1031 F-60-10) TaxID=1206466 RepID=K0KR76_WICCF|nr:uncharacterized protein BN7_4171 [Wickerhamomyces ciferrii]CCH44602.1 putative membrane protein [Wickerhamomyces ciferrii]
MTSSSNKSITKPEELDRGSFIYDVNRGDIIATTNDYSVFEDEKSPEDFSDVDEKAVLKKIDWHLLPIVSVLYLLAYLDRGNIGNAKIEGLTEDLGLTDNQYNICLTMFFIPYALFEVPSNILLKKIGKQSIYLPTIMLIWGIIMVTMGTVKGYHGLLVTRLFLGVFESGLFPGISYGLSIYYLRSELQLRQAMFYSAASIAGAFSGLLAFAIAKMHGTGGYEGWRWIFILEGLLTVIVAFVVYFIMPDYPDTAKFLTPRERKFVLWRLANDNTIKNDEIEVHSESTTSSRRFAPDLGIFNEKEHDITMKQAFFTSVKDWQIYFHILNFFAICVPTYAVALFLPSVVKNMGYSSSRAQLMTIPIYITASISAIIQGYFSDKFSIRSLFICGNLLLVIIGFIMNIVGQETGTPGVIYAGCFLAVLGLYSSFPGCTTWCANNLANSRKRAIAMAIQIGIGNFGGAFSSNFYKTGAYTMGHGLSLGFAAMGIVSSTVLVLNYKRINKKREKDLSNGKYDDTTDEEFYRMGDKSPFFKYKC